jgi:hypothetical protein
MKKVRRRFYGSLLIGILALGGLLLGCSSNPCKNVPSPPKSAIDLVQQGYDVEYPGAHGYECELVSPGYWVAEQE